MARRKKKRYTVGTGRRVKVRNPRIKARGNKSIWEFFTGGKRTRSSGTFWGFTPRRSAQYRGNGWTWPGNR